jgi:pantoate--beta-alanine ligase
VAYFGQKDYQQAAVIRKMVHDLNSPVLIKTIPTSREEDGLARSSRNGYLAPHPRRAARCLWQGLNVGKDRIVSGVGDVLSIERAVRDVIESEKEVTSIDYVAMVHPETLEPLSSVSLPLVIAVAIRMGGTRLIDNLLVEGS